VNKLFIGLGVLAGLAAAVLIAMLAYQSLKVPLRPSTGGYLAPENCMPGPCADIQGYTLWISNVSVDGTLVRMQVKFKNSSRSTHASPEDLQLIDSSRHISPVTPDSTDCKTWKRHDFNKGATFGPIDICFVVYSATPPFILHWAPDLGAFCCETDIKINPS
jgi:hypothetical protein